MGYFWFHSATLGDGSITSHCHALHKVTDGADVIMWWDAKFRLDSGVHPEGCCKPRHCRDTHEFKWTVKDGMIKRGSKGRVDGRFRRPGSSSIWNRLTSLSTTQAKQAFCCFKERAFQS